MSLHQAHEEGEEGGEERREKEIRALGCKIFKTSLFFPHMVKVIDIGRVVVKVLGREAGRKAVVVDVVDENYVLITGPKTLTGVKRRRVNINHIEPTDKKVEIKRGASDDEVMKAVEAAGLAEYMRERVKPKMLGLTKAEVK